MICDNITENLGLENEDFGDPLDLLNDDGSGVVAMCTLEEETPKGW